MRAHGLPRSGLRCAPVARTRSDRAYLGAYLDQAEGPICRDVLYLPGPSMAALVERKPHGCIGPQAVQTS